MVILWYSNAWIRIRIVKAFESVSRRTFDLLKPSRVLEWGRAPPVPAHKTHSRRGLIRTWARFGTFCFHSSIICVHTFNNTYVPGLLALRRNTRASACLRPSAVLVGLYWPLGLLLRIRYASSLLSNLSPSRRKSFFCKRYQPRNSRGTEKLTGGMAVLYCQM